MDHVVAGKRPGRAKVYNVFHTLCMKLDIKDSEWNLVLKYRGFLHRYIQDEMQFLDISSLDTTYRYVVKIEKKLKKRNDTLDL